MKTYVQFYLTLLLVACMSSLSTAQSVYYDTGAEFDRTGVWTLGINGGAAYQQSDVNLLPCWGVGLTLAKNVYHRPGGILDVDLRGRLLYTQTVGLDYERNYDIQDGVLNSGATNYSDPSGPGYVYSNYKNHTGELSIEGVLTFNRLRERTGIVLSAFGGIGVDVYNTQINQLDISGQQYSYAGINDSTQTNREICQDLKFLIDDTYETRPADADFLNFAIMPSVGLSLGYQFTDRFSMGIEHKMTFTMDDVFDGGVEVDDKHFFTPNDKYHYTSLHLRWIVDWEKRKKDKKTRPRPTPSPSPSPSPNPSTGSTNNPQTQNCPQVTINKPSNDNYTNQTNSVVIEAMLTNTSSKDQINFKVNGSNQSFNFSPSTGAFAATVKLKKGTNRIELSSSNGQCQDSDTRSISFNSEPEAPKQPIITVTNPSKSPYATTEGRHNIQATILNIASKNDVTFTINGTPNTDFGFNSGTKVFTGKVSLRPGANSLVIKAKNSAGTDQENISINYNAPASPKPLVTITKPTSNPYTSTIATSNVVGVVKNVESKGNITVTAGNQTITNYSYNAASGAFSIPVSLSNGNTVVTVKASNAEGTSTESITLIYNAPIATRPVVAITNPSSTPYTATSAAITVKGSVKNVSDKSQVTITQNNQTISNFTFSPKTGMITVPISLATGNSLIKITGQNSAGTASQSVTIVYNPVAEVKKPVVTVIAPAKTPYTSTTSSQIVKATILNVDTKNQINLIVNNKPVTKFIFNSSTHFLTATVPLSQGNNSVIIKATNSAGTDSKNIAINYIPKIDGPNVVITSPSNGTVTVKNSAVIKANIKNVTASKDVKLTVNGANQANFNYNVNTGLLIANVSLQEGKNGIKVTGMNSMGTDSKAVSITYQPATQETPRPVVTIKTPAANPSTVETPTTPLKATIQNVSSKNEITFTVNGKPSTAFVYNAATKGFAATVQLKAGSNAIAIKATNPGGTAQDTRSIIYRPKVQPELTAPPVVTIKTPSKSSTPTSNPKGQVVANVTNISNASQVSMTINGRPSTKFTYANSQVKATINLLEGKNQIIIKATNAGGSHSDNCVYVYTKGKAPVLTRIEPTTNPVTIVDTKDGIKVRIQHLDAQSSIKVTVNNQNVSQYDFNTPTEMLTAMVPLTLGNNIVKVTATNSVGTGSISFVIIRVESQNQQAPTPGGGNSGSSGTTPIGGGTTPIGGGTTPVAPTTKPSVSITAPNSSPKLSTSAQTTVSANISGVTDPTKVILLVNGKTVNRSFANGKLNSTVTLKPGLNTIIIKATNVKGLTKKESKMVYTSETSKPVVTMVNPTMLVSTRRKKSIGIQAVIANVPDKSKISCMLNGAPTTINFNPKTKVFTNNVTLRSGINTIVLKATTSSGTSTKTMTITIK